MIGTYARNMDKATNPTLPDHTVDERSHEHVFPITNPRDQFGPLWVVQYYDMYGKRAEKHCDSRTEAFYEGDWLCEENATPVAITYNGRLIHVYEVED